ncbi:hypothetical protein IFM89_012596 [Coptis chinensis]|uniref:Cytochrome P450 n=1 Tax=Coptis chinensis TaxID=261450 RepID=A0A835IN92_9MAGN|nr:hypothetical protein IFM89_012596 [Coptis chinensis]
MKISTIFRDSRLVQLDVVGVSTRWKLIGPCALEGGSCVVFLVYTLLEKMFCHVYAKSPSSPMHNPTLKQWIRTSTLLAPIIVSFIVILLFYFFKKRSSNMIRGPRRRLSIQFGVHPILVVSSWELVKACFTTNDKFFSSRLVNKAIKYMFYDQRTISFAPHGPYWRELRKMITLNLLSNERLKMLKHQRISEMDACLKKLYELSTKRKDENAGVLVDMSK